MKTKNIKVFPYLLGLCVLIVMLMVVKLPFKLPSGLRSWLFIIFPFLFIVGVGDLFASRSKNHSNTGSKILTGGAIAAIIVCLLFVGAVIWFLHQLSTW